MAHQSSTRRPSLSLLEDLHVDLFPLLSRWLDNLSLYRVSQCCHLLYFKVWKYGIWSFDFPAKTPFHTVTKYLSRSPKYLRVLDLQECPDFDNYILVQLEQCKNIKWLKLCGCPGPHLEIGLDLLLSLTRLDLSSSPLAVTPACISQIAILTNLRVLDLSKTGSSIDNEHLKLLSSLTQLQYLNLDCEGIREYGLLALTTLVSIQSLNLENCDNLADTTFDFFRVLRGLRTLGLHALNEISSEPFQEGICALTNLTALKLEQMGTITDTAFENQQIYRSLTNLRVFQILECDLLTQRMLEGISLLKKLTALHLSSLELTDSGLEVVKGMTQLRTLEISQTELPALCIKPLQHLYRLRTLALGLTSFAATDDLQFISRLTTLKKLDLEDVGPLSDKDLLYLVSLTHLTNLNLGGTETKFTGTGLWCLSSLVNITEITVPRYLMDSPEAVLFLKSCDKLRAMDLHFHKNDVTREMATSTNALLWANFPGLRHRILFQPTD